MKNSTTEFTKRLGIVPKVTMIYENRYPKLAVLDEGLFKEDSKVRAIMAVLILANLICDREIAALELIFHCYGVIGHKNFPASVNRKPQTA